MTSALHAADVRASDVSYPWLTHYPKNVDWHQSFTATPLYELLDSAVAKYGSRPATNFLGKVLTYKEIAKATDRDKYYSAEEAKEFGLVDDVLMKMADEKKRS
jgi:hypothetical protein